MSFELRYEEILKPIAKNKQSLGGKKKVVQISAQPKGELKTRTKIAKMAKVSHDTVSKV